MGKTKIQDWITDEGLIKIEKWAGEGMTIDEIALKMKINRNTLLNWCKKYVSINNALKKSKESLDGTVIKNLYARCLPSETKVVKQFFDVIDGERDLVREEVTITQIPPSETAMFFWLKNRCEEWGNSDLITRKKIKEEIKLLQAKLATYDKINEIDNGELETLINGLKLVLAGD